MSDQGHTYAIEGGRFRNLTPSVGCGIPEFPVELSRINTQREPLLLAGTENYRVSSVDKTGCWCASAKFPSHFPALCFEGINISAGFTAAIGRDEHQGFVDERVSMKTKWATVDLCVIRPDFFTCHFIQ